MEPVPGRAGVVHAKRPLQASIVIEQASWFQGCHRDTLQAILDKAVARELRLGDTLSRCGDSIQKLTLIIDGVLELSVTATSGRRHIAGYLGQRDFLNLVPFLDAQGAVHDCVALTDCFTLQLGNPLFTDLLARDPAFVPAIFRLLCESSRQIYSRLADNSLRPLRQRVAQMLLHLANHFGVIRFDGIHLSLKVSQDQLSGYVGCSRPILNQELKQLELEGLIKVQYSHVSILDESHLRAIASTV